MIHQHPTSLYVHYPWCVRKCPYCDFNSHRAQDPPFAAYTNKLLSHLAEDQERFGIGHFDTVFFGGGTPSLCPPQELAHLLDALSKQNAIDAQTEITLEANPGTLDQNHLKGFRQAGVNRLSLGVQSFNDEHLKKLGRIHSSQEAKKALDYSASLGFNSINIDLMYALPEQSLDQAMQDLETALSFGSQHLSWYELTLEPNTAYYQQPPPLPNHDEQAAMADAGQTLLANHGWQHYEISAFAKAQKHCQHNLNYWHYRDYLGIGAGAHSKLTRPEGIIRCMRHKHPKTFLSDQGFLTWQKIDSQTECFEFALNRWRLTKPLALTELDNLSFEAQKRFQRISHMAREQGFIYQQQQSWCKTQQGLDFHNQLVSLYLSEDEASKHTEPKAKLNAPKV